MSPAADGPSHPSSPAPGSADRSRPDSDPVQPPTRLERQLAFLIEIDKLKDVIRRNYLVHGERRENTAEHSWHLAMAALVLAEHAEGEVDLGRVVPMLLVHDLVEIDAGDTFRYDAVAGLDKAEREARAADRIFALLPERQGEDLRALWDEFEAALTPDARFASAVDHLMPILHNYHSEGRGWREHGIHAGQVLTRNRGIEQGSAALWERVREAVADAVARGLLAAPPAG